MSKPGMAGMWLVSQLVHLAERGIREAVDVPELGQPVLNMPT